MKSFTSLSGDVYYQPTIEDMVGKTFTEVINHDGNELVFKGPQGTFTFYHDQNCCESVSIEDVVGDLSDLVGEPLLIAEEVSNDEGPVGSYDDSFTWTFYKFATRKGYVDVRWYGTSNGYYSESVDLRFSPD